MVLSEQLFMKPKQLTAQANKNLTEISKAVPPMEETLRKALKGCT